MNNPDSTNYPGKSQLVLTPIYNTYRRSGELATGGSMGILAELYVASDDQQALKYDASPDIFAHRRQYRRFTALELSTLWAIMQGTEWDVVLIDAFPALLVVDGGERLVHRLPEPMIEALAKMAKEEILTSSEKWASTAELRCKPSDVQPIIEGLVQLSREASAAGKAVYLWNCV